MNGIDPWQLFGFGVSPMTPTSDIASIINNLGVVGSAPVNQTNIWDAIAKVGSAAVSTFLTPSPQVANGPFDPRNNLPGIVGDIQRMLSPAEIQPILANALPARCATTAGMAGLPCVVHQGGPYKGKLVKSNRRRKVKLVPDGQGSFTPVICCTPRRMNPLNPRALRRAAVRLGRFQHIAHTIEKMVARAVKPRGRRSSPKGYVRSSVRHCPPMRCG